MEDEKKKFNFALGLRRAKELELLQCLPPEFVHHQKSTGSSLLIQVEMNSCLVKSSHLERSFKWLLFDLLIDENFPVSAPKVRAVTSFSFPSIADGRDLIQDVLRREWELSCTLFEIITSLPQFVDRYLEETWNGEYRWIGRFQLGDNYDIGDWQTLPTCAVFRCQRCTDDLSSLHLIVSESAWLLFTPSPSNANIGKLIVCASLVTLSRIERDLSNPSKLVLFWHKQRDLFKEELIVEKASYCISFVVAQIRKFHSQVSKVVLNRHCFSEPEVLESSVTGTNILQVLGEIVCSERQLNACCSFEHLQKLLEKYRSAVEYYSALGDPQFHSYLNKIQDLMKREDTQACLGSIS